jgi:hypothetical protein
MLDITALQQFREQRFFTAWDASSMRQRNTSFREP